MTVGRAGQRCFHRWSRQGKCIAPGCHAVRVDGQEGLPHPNALSPEKVQQIRDLLPHRSVTEIAREVGVAMTTVRQVRRDEAGRS